jgi:hypothetical protein
VNSDYRLALDVCKRHADRLVWAMTHLQEKFPLSPDTLETADGVELAILDQFLTRFAKLQDAMGAKLFPAVLELTKEEGNLVVFIDKLNRLEKIGAIPSAENWLLLREMRNIFSHDYPDDPEIQTAILNKAYKLAADLLSTLNQVEKFSEPYAPSSQTWDNAS